MHETNSDFSSTALYFTWVQTEVPPEHFSSFNYIYARKSILSSKKQK